MKISVIIPTLNRIDCLSNLLKTILNQGLKPFEVIIVDQSDNDIVYDFFNEIKFEFQSRNIKLIYSKQSLKSLAIARNFGIFIASGDWLSFLDDDVILDKNYYFEINSYIDSNPNTILLQGNIKNLTNDSFITGLIKKFFLFDQNSNNNGCIYPSFFGNLPTHFTEIKKCMWTSGCNFFVRAETAKKLKFDGNLISYSFAEDKDFSYRVYKTYPDSVFAIPTAKLEHLESPIARMQALKLYYMRSVYIYYFFFKNIDKTPLNILLFIWSRIGILTIYLIPRIKILPKLCCEFKFIKHLQAELFALKHFKSLKRQNLDFFNEWYYKQ